VNIERRGPRTEPYGYTTLSGQEDKDIKKIPQMRVGESGR
jgi:hypothetical protein